MQYWPICGEVYFIHITEWIQSIFILLKAELYFNELFSNIGIKSGIWNIFKESKTVLAKNFRRLEQPKFKLQLKDWLLKSKYITKMNILKCLFRLVATYDWQLPSNWQNIADHMKSANLLSSSWNRENSMLILPNSRKNSICFCLVWLLLNNTKIISMI